MAYEDLDYSYGPPAELAGSSSYYTPTTDYNATPAGWYDQNGNWNSYADAAAAAGPDALNQYVTGGQDYSYSAPTDWMGLANQYGPAITGGLSLLGNLYAYNQMQQTADAQRALTKAQTAAVKSSTEQNQGQFAMDRSGDVDKAKLILGRMQQKGMLAPGVDPNELLGRMYGTSKQVFGPGTQYNLNAFANNPYSQVPVWTPLNAQASQSLACGGMVEDMAGGGLAALGRGQADDVPINASGGEYVIPADTVSDLGDGNSNAGGLALDHMVKAVRAHKGRKNALPPKAKSAAAYLKGR